MANPRKHHLVPQFYQRGFARKRGNRWEAKVVNLDHPERDGTHNVENIYVQRDWNTITDKEGKKEFVVETMLADYVEGPAAPAMKAMRDHKFPLIEPWWDATALFMAIQLTRGRDMRENLTRFVSELQHMVMKMSVAHYDDAKWEEVLGFVPDEATLERMGDSEKHVTITPTTAYLLQLSLGPAPEVAEMLAMRTWTLVEFDQPCLLTAENPVVHINPSGESLGHGVATAEQMYLPVSPSQGLLLSHPWAEWPHARMRAKLELAERLNWAVFTQPNNRSFLMHPDVTDYPMPGPALLQHNAWWPWGEDPKAKPPPHRHYRASVMENWRRRDRA